MSSFILTKAVTVDRLRESVALEDIASVDLFRHVVKACVVAVGDKGVTLRLELHKVVHHAAAEERRVVLDGYFS